MLAAGSTGKGRVAAIDLGRVGPQGAYELGRRVDRPDAEAVIMPGGNWPSLTVVERLEQDLGKPVLANNAAEHLGGPAAAQAPRAALPATAGCFRENLNRCASARASGVAIVQSASLGGETPGQRS